MKRIVTILILTIQCYPLLSCGPAFEPIAGYVYLTDGPINRSHLQDFIPRVYDEYGASISQASFCEVAFLKKTKYASDFADAVYLDYQNDQSTHRHLIIDSFVQTLNYGDSVFILSFFSIPPLPDPHTPTPRAPSYHMHQGKYVLTNDEDALLRLSPAQYIRTTPNPARRYIDLDVKLFAEQEYSIHLLNQSGQELYSEAGLSAARVHRLSLDGVPHGPYYLYFVFAGEAYLKRIVKLDAP